MSSAHRQRTSYETIPYKSQPFSLSHPQHLAMLGRLFGVAAADPSTARILEIGCAAGENILPLAELYPSATIRGIDTSASAIAAATARATALGVSNITFSVEPLEQFTDSIPFDYIICHGIYSWVDETTRQSLLRLIPAHLAENGICYLSYNCYPGWHLRDMLRGMLHYHAAQFSDDATFIAQARSMASFLRKGLAANNSPLSVYVKNTLEAALEQPDWYLRHDLLEEHNTSFYFHQLVEAATAHQLQYLGDAELQTMLDYDFSEDVQESLRVFSADPVRMEQYMDFLRNCSFRRTLLCHQRLPLSRDAFLDRIAEMYIGSPLQPESDSTFVDSRGRAVQAEGSLLAYALQYLHSIWPRAEFFPTLLLQAQLLRVDSGEKKLAGDEDAFELLLAIWKLAGAGMLELRSEASPFATALSERPVASPLARLQAVDGIEVTNRKHEVIVLDEASRTLLLLLDGSRDLRDLAKLHPSVNEQTLEALADAALLVG